MPPFQKAPDICRLARLAAGTARVRVNYVDAPPDVLPESSQSAVDAVQAGLRRAASRIAQAIEAGTPEAIIELVIDLGDISAVIADQLHQANGDGTFMTAGRDEEDPFEFIDGPAVAINVLRP